MSYPLYSSFKPRESNCSEISRLQSAWTRTDRASVTHITFETGSDELRGLEQKIYVGSGRFVVEAGKPTVVEYNISEVVA